MAPAAARVSRGVEVGAAFALATTAFAVVAVALAAAGTDFVAVPLAFVALASVLLLSRRGHPAYAIPIAIAVMVAYDWFRFPPTHPEAFPDAENFFTLLAYLVVGVFVGELAVVARRRADISEAARTLLTDEQASLRRVATLVAEVASQHDVFDAIAHETRRLLGTEEIRLWRYEGRDAVVVASEGAQRGLLPAAARHELGGADAASRVFAGRTPVRIDDYDVTDGTIGDAAKDAGIQSVAAAPVIVDRRLWGCIVVGTTRAERLPPDSEVRLALFTELMATAIANTESRARADRLAEEQAALRRIATLVAEGASPATVFDAVAAEMERLLDADGVTVSRYEPDSGVIVLAQRGAHAERVPPGSRWSHEGENVTASVRRTGRPARRETYTGTHGAIAKLVDDLSVQAAVGAPVVVDGRLWGVVIAIWRHAIAPPADTEQRMAQFAGLLETAVANAVSREQLTASRARLLTAGDEARRRVVRDLHDGAQQRLVHSIVTLKLALRALQRDGDDAEGLITEALAQVQLGNEELRELSHGILPPVLSRGGLEAGVTSLVARLRLPVDLDIAADRFSAEIEANAYFIVAEALTNVVKHAQATRAEVRASVRDGTLCIEVRDDGVGGADPAGHGLVGMRDRATALGGRLAVVQTDGGGTCVAATLPAA